MEGILGELTGMLAIGVGYVAVLVPVFIVWIVFLYGNKDKKNRYEAVIAVSKNIQDPGKWAQMLIFWKFSENLEKSHSNCFKQRKSMGKKICFISTCFTIYF